MRPKTILALFLGCVGGAAVLWHFQQGGGPIDKTLAWVIGGCILTAAFLADSKAVGEFVSRNNPLPHGRHDKSDDPADHRGT